MTLSINDQAATTAEAARSITATDLRALLEARDDVVVADASEGEDYAAGHISVSVPVPASEVELRLSELVARTGVPIVFTGASGDGDDLADQAAELARTAGYTDVRVLRGGNPAWVAAGFQLITNVNSLSKALGEFVERRYDTPRVTVEQLKAKIDAGEDIVILDTRPFDEYHAISIPGGVDAPGPELLYRAYDQVPKASTQVVVNCAGRTRAIIGAQTLINAGFPNPVVSLENGTTAWLLAGYHPGRGDEEVAAEPSADNRARAADAAREVARRFGIREITRAELDEARATAGERSLYLFDVRTHVEYVTGHLDGTRSVPGGQLVQKTDYYIGSRNGRVVVIDDADGVRARTTAGWLTQLGLPDVSVYLLGDDPLVTGEEPRAAVPGSETAASVDVEELAASLTGEWPRPLVIDLEPARPYVLVRHHIPGSVVARRSSLRRLLSFVPEDTAIVFTSADGRLAQLAAAEHGVGRPVRALAGGTQAWQDSGREVGTGSTQESLDPAEKIPEPQTLEQRRAHLDWYVKWGDHIVDELERDGLVQFVDPR
ncbi:MULTISPECIES: rhodanese-like domain-containing protein [unclassified Mycobacterium]|uniref:rhodanese-like domain-containing protein n=1 Tax=unclassified Mycobacterium TaxID=2642494 RepID=UPI0029C75643|nr:MULTISPECIES: rhodanese-like domain-containing protein [unclassified Mycobacterium]